MSNDTMNQGKMRDTNDALPIVGNPDLPKMDEGPVRPKRIKRKVRRMAEKVDPHYRPRGSKRKLNLMSPVPEGESAESPNEVNEMPDQQEEPRRQNERAVQEQYVRLRLRVEDGQMSIIGIHVVDGPLQLPNRLHAGLAYEVMRGNKRIGLGTLPDVGVSRSFPDPEAKDERRGHALFEMSSYEFSARIPRAEFSNWALPRININVYRLKSDISSSPVQAEPLSAQFRTVRPIAQLDGIRRNALSIELTERLDQSLRDNINR